MTQTEQLEKTISEQNPLPADPEQIEEFEEVCPPKFEQMNLMSIDRTKVGTRLACQLIKEFDKITHYPDNYFMDPNRGLKWFEQWALIPQITTLLGYLLAYIEDCDDRTLCDKGQELVEEFVGIPYAQFVELAPPRLFAEEDGLEELVERPEEWWEALDEGDDITVEATEVESEDPADGDADIRIIAVD